MENKNKSNIFYAFKLVWQANKGYILWTFLRNIYNVVFSVYLNIYMMKYILTCIEEERPFSELLTYVSVICACHILVHFVSAYHEYYKRNNEPVIYKNIFGKIMDISSAMEYKRFEQPDFYDKYTRALDASLSHVFLLIDQVGWLIGAVLSVVISVIFVAGVDPVLLLFPVVPAIAAVVLSTRQSKLWYDLDVDTTRDNRIIGYTRRVFYEKKYAGEIRLFGIKNVLFDYHRKSIEKKYETEKKYRKKITLFEALTRCVFSLMCVILPFIYIAVFVKTNPEIQVGAYIAAAIAAMEFIAWRINWSTWLITDIRKEVKFIKNLRDFLEYKPENKNGKNIEAPDSIEAIEINNLSFTYEGSGKPTLRNLTLSLKKGEKIALVGHNGAGKTTLIKLIMGLYEATDGKIKANGVNINDYEPKSYRSRFGTVFQDFQVFALTIAENVLYHKPRDEKERRLVISSLEKAQFGDVLEKLSDGIDTAVSHEFDEDGIVLSGGQSQKLAIARVFAKNPDVVILDEPSSALDPIAEYNMYENMMKLSENKAVIFISHRLSSARLADKIYMLENGAVIEQGTHKELMEIDGKYAEMFNLQAQNYQESLPEEMEAVLNAE